MIVSVSSWGLNQDHLGWIIDDHEDIDKLLMLSRKYEFNPTGEGGEYETLTLDAKNFRCPINILDTDKKWMGDSGYLIIRKAILDLNRFRK